MPGCELLIGFPPTVNEMAVRRVFWASLLGKPTRSATTGGAQFRLLVNKGPAPDPPSVKVVFVSRTFKADESHYPRLESCSGSFPPQPPLPPSPPSPSPPPHPPVTPPRPSPPLPTQPPPSPPPPYPLPPVSPPAPSPQKPPPPIPPQPQPPAPTICQCLPPVAGPGKTTGSELGSFCGLWDLELGDTVGCPFDSLDVSHAKRPWCHRPWCFVDANECNLPDVATAHNAARAAREGWNEDDVTRELRNGNQLPPLAYSRRLRNGRPQFWRPLPNWKSLQMVRCFAATATSFRATSTLAVTATSTIPKPIATQFSLNAALASTTTPS